MSSSVIMVLSVVGCVLGFFLNRAYAKKYEEPAIQWGPCVLQILVTGVALARFPEHGMSRRFLFWLVLLAAVYVFGLWECRKHAVKQQAAPGDIVSAMIAQTVLPLGAVPAAFMLVGMLVFGFLWAH